MSDWNIDYALMTKREMFAMAATQGIIGKLSHSHVDGKGDPETHAKWAVLYADALIAELAKEQQ